MVDLITYEFDMLYFVSIVTANKLWWWTSSITRQCHSVLCLNSVNTRVSRANFYKMFKKFELWSGLPDVLT